MESKFDCTKVGDVLVAPLRCFRRGDLQQAGGKGANLGELLRAGFPAPPGFIVTTDAYDLFVAENELGEVIGPALAQGQRDGSAIRAAFERAPIPPAVEQEILAAYVRLGQGAVAVRSSATAEDLPHAAFAGQQDTYLNIVGAQALLDAVRRCWASLWTERAIAYRERLGLEQETVRMAVVVQRMVAAEAAGVLFTANTVTGARDEALIDASPGLGEAVVSGQVTPDHYVLKKRWRRWHVVEQRYGRREVIVRARTGGGIEHVEGAAVEAPALPEPALRQLAQLGEAIEHHFGAPQDVEWAWAEGRPFILQARPITALPAPAPRPNRVQRFMAGNFAEIFAVRPYPLDVDVWIPALAGAIEPMFELLGLEWRLNHLFEDQDGIVMHYQGRLPRPTWRSLFGPARFLWRALRYDPVQWQSDPLLAQAQARARELESRKLQALSWEQLLATVQAAREIPRFAGEIRGRYLPAAALAIARLRLMLGVLGHGGRLAALLSGAENKTMEANQALEALAEPVRSDPDLAHAFARHEPPQLMPVLQVLPAGRAFLSELDVFLARYGHRETALGTALQPTWKDAPAVVLGIVKSLAAHAPRPESSKPAWRVARDDVLGHRLLQFAPLRSVFLSSLVQARALLQIREDTHFYATLPVPVLRRTLLECGRRLVQNGVLDREEDVFHLKLDELAQVADRDRDGALPPKLAAELRAAMERRKAERARLEETPLVDPRLFQQRATVGDALLRGLPGSPGVAEGPARLVRSGSEFDRLGAGDVLVAPYTNPAWTPLFQRAAAVVVDSGSPASHAAIVAREYGIPAVMGTVSGTQTIQNGQRIRVDGNQGAVFGVDAMEEV